MSNCPKCNKKISAFYFKQNCPHCNANLMYYDFDNRLKADAEIAEKEWDTVDRIIKGIVSSTVGSVISIVRLCAFVLSIVALLLPSFKENVNLISIIKDIIGNSSSVFGDTKMLLCFVAMVSVIVFALVGLIFTLFSFLKPALKVSIIISAIGIVAFIGLGIGVAVAGGGVLYGFAVSLAMQIAVLVFHIKKLSSAK